MNRFALILFAALFITSDPATAEGLVLHGKRATHFASTEPQIVQVRGRMVKVRVPKGFERVTLQAMSAPQRGRRAVSPTAARGEWRTVAVNYPQQEGAVIEIRLDRLTPRRHLRVFGEREETLPGDLLTGITHFLPELPVALSISAQGVPRAVGTGSLDFGVTNAATSQNAVGNSGGGVAAPRAVAEADIWKLRGDRLYFFNDRRGLQVFDLANPEDPALLGTLRMPGMGEDMYLLDDAHVVLLKKAWNWYWWDDWNWGGGGLITLHSATPTTLSLSASRSSIATAQLIAAPERQANGRREIVIADVRDGQPRVVGSVEFEGTVRESRLVGKVLYLATEVHRLTSNGGSVEWGVEVTSFDLHDPAHPVRRASVFLGGWANAVSATDQTFLVAKWGANGGSQIDILDISDPNGAMTRGGSVVVTGQVADKFKMRQAGDVLTVVSQRWRARTQAEIDEVLNLPAGAPRPVRIWASQVGITMVNTFSLADPAMPAPLGSLELAVDETLHATRFDGDRLYIITAQHRPWIHVTYVWDPLWIVDLANPAQPRVLGELEMPGFSTYIEPLGDRLVTIGLLDGKPTVSLFGISDVSAPTELSRVQLDAGQWTSSEAVWNEKAFSVLPAENLILMPLSGWNATTGSTGGVQLLDLRRDRVVKRGLLAQPIAPRRATVHRGRIVAISPEHLLTIDATNRDQPRVTADVEIAWNVNRLFAIGTYLVQLGSEGSRGETQGLTLTVSPADQPDESLEVLSLPGAPLADATLRDGVLYLVQVREGASAWDYAEGVQRQTSPDRLTLSAVDVSRLPQLRLIGSVTTEAPHRTHGWGGSSGKTMWINETTLAFTQTGGGQQWIVPYWNDPAPYDTGHRVWVPNPEVPSVDGEAIDAASEADVTVTQIYLGKAPGHYEWVKDGSIDPPGLWHPQYVYRSTQRVFAFDVSNPARLRFASHVEIGASEPWDVAAPVAVDGKLFASYQPLGTLRTWESFRAANASDPAAFRDVAGVARTHRHFLQQVDYSDPRNPVLAPDHPNLPGRLIGTARDGRVLFSIGQRYEWNTGKPDNGQRVLHASALSGNVVHLLDQLPLADGWSPPVLREQTVFQLEVQPSHLWEPSAEPFPGGDTLPLALGETTVIARDVMTVSGLAYRRPYWNPGHYVENPKKSTLTAWELGADGKFGKLDELGLAHETSLHLFGDLGVVYERANQPRFLDVSNPVAFRVLGFHNFDGAPSLNYDRADGAAGQGLWIPAGQYGVEGVLFAK